MCFRFEIMCTQLECFRCDDGLYQHFLLSDDLCSSVFNRFFHHFQLFSFSERSVVLLCTLTGGVTVWIVNVMSDWQTLFVCRSYVDGKLMSHRFLSTTILSERTDRYIYWNNYSVIAVLFMWEHIDWVVHVRTYRLSSCPVACCVTVSDS